VALATTDLKECLALSIASPRGATLAVGLLAASVSAWAVVAAAAEEEEERVAQGMQLGQEYLKKE